MIMCMDTRFQLKFQIDARIHDPDLISKETRKRGLVHTTIGR